MPDFIKAIILGIVEGVTEFLPISSTGHLIVASDLLDFQALNGTFEIFIQLGAVVAVVLYYRSRLWRQVLALREGREGWRFWLNLFIAFLPAAVLGFLFADVIQAALFNPTVVALALIVGGIVFLVVERRLPPPSGDQMELSAEADPMHWRQALGIGLAQTLALIPGMSRSGASIIGGLLVGLGRPAATEFSFFLAIPTLGLATVYSLVRSLDQLRPDDMLNLGIGAVVSGVVAWLSIGWLLRFVSRHNFVPFGVYRILAGLVILALVAARVL